MALPTIRPGSPEWDEWEQYFFFHLEWEPWMLKEVRIGNRQEMTVPEPFPGMFDQSFVYDPAKPKYVHKVHTVLAKELRENYEELKKRYGFGWGVDETAVDKLIPKRGSRRTDGKDLYNQTVRAFREKSDPEAAGR